MNDERRWRPAPPHSPHLDDDTLERFAAAELDAGERARARAHADVCPSCAALLRGVELLQAGAREFDSGAPQAAAGPGQRRWLPIAVAATIAIAVLVPMVTTQLSAPSAPGSTTRSAGSYGPIPISPSGQVAAMPARFEWHPVNGARSYALLLFRQDGTLLWEGRATGASVERPADLQLAPGKYYWRVRALMEENTAAESNLAPFEISQP